MGGEVGSLKDRLRVRPPSIPDGMTSNVCVFDRGIRSPSSRSSLPSRVIDRFGWGLRARSG